MMLREPPSVLLLDLRHAIHAPDVVCSKPSLPSDQGSGLGVWCWVLGVGVGWGNFALYIFCFFNQTTNQLLKGNYFEGHMLQTYDIGHTHHYQTAIRWTYTLHRSHAHCPRDYRPPLARIEGSDGAWWWIIANELVKNKWNVLVKLCWNSSGIFFLNHKILVK